MDSTISGDRDAPSPKEGYVRAIEPSELAGLIGREVGASEWRDIDQPMIDHFAELTGDCNPIHVDPGRAASGPFGTTIAHGFLSLSLLSGMSYEACPGVLGPRTTVNYGFNKVRFIRPVLCGSRVRGRFVLKDFSQQPDGRWQAVYTATVEIDGQPQPALVAEWVTAGV